MDRKSENIITTGKRSGGSQFAMGHEISLRTALSKLV